MPAKPTLTRADVDALVNARHPQPRSLLGYHEIARSDEQALCLVRVLEPDAEQVEVRWDDGAPATPLACIHEAGLFEGRVPFRRPLEPYQLHIRYRDGHEHTKHDPYFFAPQLTDFDLHLFGEGTHVRGFDRLGARPITHGIRDGVHFAVWAPSARRVPATNASR